jgi:membrane protein implicated in regulation of membrane protease activity
MNEVSKTTIAGIAHIAVTVCGFVLYAFKVLTLQDAIAAIIAFNSVIAGAGLMAARDDSKPTTISQTTVQETGAGQVVKVETELSEGKQ